MQRALLALILIFVSQPVLAQWRDQDSGTKENLRGVSAASAEVIWASGTHGTYLQSTDGGTHWRAAQVPGAETLDFRDVEAFSADEAYLLAAGPGEQSRIYKTTDGGKNWALQFTNRDPKGFFDCMAFWGRDYGIAVGDPVNGKFQLIKTENGGKEWKAIPPEKLPPAIEGESAFAASGTCLVTEAARNVWFVTGGSRARVFRSNDAGETWSVAETPIAHGLASAGIFSVAFRDEKHGVIAGGDYQKPYQSGPNLAISEDGGLTWTLAPLDNSFYFSAVAYKPDKGVLAVGTGGSVRYPPDGSFWESDHVEGLNAIAVTDPRIVAVGAKGHISITSSRPGTAEGTASLVILSDVHGVDVSDVVNAAAQKIKLRWFNLVPEVARAPLRKQGFAIVDFSIQSDGSISGAHLFRTSGDWQLDQAALRSVVDSSPIERLPFERDLSSLKLRINFRYNPPKP
jgi:TonB family protein